MLEFDHAGKRFGSLTALDDCSFTARPGRLTGFVGPYGAGKTTAMRSVFGLVEPDAGRVRWNGAPVDAATRARFGYMPEERGLYPRMRVDEQLVYLGEICGRSGRDVRRTVDGWLERLELAARAHDRLDTLSHGNQQRVQLVAALVNEPEFVGRGADVWLGTEGGTYGAPVSTPGVTAVAAPDAEFATGDLDGDGRADLVTLAVDATAGLATVATWRGQPDGTFVPGESRQFGVPADIWEPALALGDLAGDGTLDAVVSGSTHLWALTGDGLGGLGAPSVTTTGRPLIGLSLGDVDGDGLLDAASIARHRATETRPDAGIVLFGDGATFGDPHEVRLSGDDEFADSVLAADIGLDARADLVFGAHHGTQVFLDDLDGRTHR